MADAAVYHVGAVADIAPAVTAANDAFGSIAAMIVDAGALAGTALTADAGTGTIPVALAAAHVAFPASVTGITCFIPLIGCTAVVACKRDTVVIIVSIGIRIDSGCIYSFIFTGCAVQNQDQCRKSAKTDAQPFHEHTIGGEVDQGGNCHHSKKDDADHKGKGVQPRVMQDAACNQHQDKGCNGCDGTRKDRQKNFKHIR